MELGESNVRVNSISPGGIATGIFGKVFNLPDDKAEETIEKAREILAGAQPLPRAGLPDDIAKAALFLASDEATFINGHNLIIDGGMVGGRLWSQQQEAWKRMQESFGTVIES
jgi:NAD(P)-dependent dehydrogenase (short-subunit alcohol dehydrogenase family)